MRPIGACTGYAPAGCGEWGYASSDIFHLEVCMYSAMCSNRNSLFEVGADDEWRCELDWDGYQRLRDWLLAGLTDRPPPPPVAVPPSPPPNPLPPPTPDDCKAWCADSIARRGMEVCSWDACTGCVKCTSVAANASG